MEEEIIKTSLLGTERYQKDLSLPFTDIMQKISVKADDKESLFLAQSAVYFLLKDASATVTAVVPDEYPLPDAENYINKYENAVVRLALKDDNMPLLQFCMNRIKRKQLIVTPYIVPDVLEKCPPESKMGKMVVPLCGQTGRNILKMKGTDTDIPESTEDDIESADFERICERIRSIRQTDSPKIWEVSEGDMESVFERIVNREKADRRAALIELLNTGLSLRDEDFLQKQLKVKSKTVKSVALRLLLQLKGSSVQHDFSGLMHELVSYEQQKQLLGLKKTMRFVLADSHQLSKEQKEYGLEEVSSEKGVSDVMYHLFQCISMMPLDLIASCFEISEQEVIDKLYTEWNNPYIQKAFIRQAHTYRSPLLISHLINLGADPLLLDYIPYDEACRKYARMYNQELSATAQAGLVSAMFNRLLSDDNTDIPPELMPVILAILRSDCYSLQSKQYYQLGLHLTMESVMPLQHGIVRALAGNDYYLHHHLTQMSRGLTDKLKFII